MKKIIIISLIIFCIFYYLSSKDSNTDKKNLLKNIENAVNTGLNGSSDQSKTDNTSDANNSKNKDFNQWDWYNKFVPLLSIGLLIISVIFFLMITLLVIKQFEKNLNYDLLKIFIIPLIIFASVFLMIVGYDDKQISPVMGLFGSIVGYLLGKSDDNKKNKEDKNNKK